MNNYFTIFQMQFSYYGLLIGVAAAIVIFYILKRFKNVEIVDILFVILTTVLGARLLFIINNPDKIWGFFNFNQGGLGLFGAIAGLMIGSFIVIKRRKIKFLFATDAIFLILPLAQAIGRLGNYFNQELYGLPTALPWSIYIDPTHRLPGYENYSYFHPTFAYEAILNIVLFIILFVINRKFNKIKTGLITSVYLITYGVIRLLVNILRIDKEYILGIENSILYSIIFIVLGLILFIKIKYKVRPKV